LYKFRNLIKLDSKILSAINPH